VNITVRGYWAVRDTAAAAVASCAVRMSCPMFSSIQ